MKNVTLYGFKPSVYSRIAKLVLAEKSISYHFQNIDPFVGKTSPPVHALHPFGLVPILDHAGFCIYETAAITRYLDAQSPPPHLVPTQAKAAARMAQVIAIVDAHAYWPMVRQVFAHRVYRPAEGLVADESVVSQGAAAAETVLGALDRIAKEGLVLNRRTATLADCHLAPMVAAFAAAPEGRIALQRHGTLSAWWQSWKTRDTTRATDAGFDHLSSGNA
ncbi:MAG: glutathione S-transferase family protein [Roseobacter sp.]